MFKSYYILLFLFIVNHNFAQEKEPALTPTHRLNIEWWKNRHEEKIIPPQVNPQLVLLGNSILHTLDYSDRNVVWHKYLKKYRTLNLGFSGDRTENVIWRLENGEIENINPKLIILLIGTNNTDGNHFLNITQPEELQKAIWKITRMIRERLPRTKILILGIFPYGYKANYRDNLNKKTNTFLALFPKKDSDILYKDIGEILLYINVFSVILGLSFH